MPHCFTQDGAQEELETSYGIEQIFQPIDDEWKNIGYSLWLTDEFDVVSSEKCITSKEAHLSDEAAVTLNKKHMNDLQQIHVIMRVIHLPLLLSHTFC